jgi:transcriptional regulator with XRE-family HTH domain
VSERGRLLQQVMTETGTTQNRLARLSGVHQPSISQFLSGRTELSDGKLGRLLECMGYRLEVVRRTVRPDLTRSERRSWRLHQQLSAHLTPQTLGEWRPHIESCLHRLCEQVTGQPHQRNLDRWERLVRTEDVSGIRRVLTGLDRDSIEMREVSPLGGLLGEDYEAGTNLVVPASVPPTVTPGNLAQRITAATGVAFRVSPATSSEEG